MPKRVAFADSPYRLAIARGFACGTCRVERVIVEGLHYREGEVPDEVVVSHDPQCELAPGVLARFIMQRPRESDLDFQTRMRDIAATCPPDARGLVQSNDAGHVLFSVRYPTGDREADPATA